MRSEFAELKKMVITTKSKTESLATQVAHNFFLTYVSWSL